MGSSFELCDENGNCLAEIEDVISDGREYEVDEQYLELFKTLGQENAVLSADWGSGSGAARSMFDVILAMRLYVLQQLTVWATINPRLVVKSQLSFHWGRLKFDALTAAHAGGEKTLVTEMVDTNDDTCWLTPSLTDDNDQGDEDTRTTIGRFRSKFPLPERLVKRRRKCIELTDLLQANLAVLMPTELVLIILAYYSLPSVYLEFVRLLESWYKFRPNVFLPDTFIFDRETYSVSLTQPEMDGGLKISIPYWDSPTSAFPDPMFEAYQCGVFGHSGLEESEYALRGWLLLVNWPFVPISRWNATEVQHICACFERFRPQIVETIMHWNLPNFFRLLRTATSHNLSILYT